MRVHNAAFAGALAFVATGILATLLALGAPTTAHATALAPSVIKSTALQASAENTATLIIQFDDRRSAIRTIDFSDPISGIAALDLSGIDATVGDTSFGPSVCALQGVGCPAEDCFCNPDYYWGYNFWDGAAWKPYPVGASQSKIADTGAIEGWRWTGADGSMRDPKYAIAAAQALGWLQSQQDVATGGYGDSVAGAVEVVLALGANDQHIEQWRNAQDSPSLADFMRSRTTKFSRTGAGEASKLAVAAAAGDACRSRAMLAPTDYFSPTIGAFAADAGFNAWGILGTVAISKAVPSSAVDSLLALQQPSGGWEWQAGFGADTNTTSLVIQALVATGRPITATEIISAVTFLAGAQQPDGGFVYDPATPEYGSDANSTAYVIMGLNAANEQVDGERWTTTGGATPYSYLLGLQQPDGSFEWQPGSGPNLLATAQAAPALLGRSYPYAIRSLEACAVRARK